MTWDVLIDRLDCFGRFETTKKQHVYKWDTQEGIRNSGYENDIDGSFRYSKWILMILGVWPVINKQRTGYLAKLPILGGITMIGFTFVPSALHTIFREKNPLRRIILIGPVCMALSSISKYSLMVLRADALNFCIESIESDWMSIVNEEELEIMRKNAKIGCKITIVCSLCLYTGGTFYNAIMPLLKPPKINEYNVTIRPLTYPGYDIFVDTQTSPNYEIIFALICVSAFFRYTVAIAVCSLAGIFVCHVCGQIQIMIRRLGLIFEGIADAKERPAIIRERISSAIHYHTRSLRLCTEIDEAMKEIFLIEVVAATTIICLLGYYLMTEWNNSDPVGILTYFLLLMSYIFNIFVLCYIGELLKKQYEEVGKAAYMIEWHRLPGKNGLAILLIMLISNYSRQITAGRMMEFSLISFGAIIRTSMAYLNMLRTVKV